MATVVLRQSTSDRNKDCAKKWQSSLWHSLQVELPRYAQPLFIRITNEIEKTPTQKYKKKKLQDQSFVNCGADLVYFRDDAVSSFVLLDETMKCQILTGKHRV